MKKISLSGKVDRLIAGFALIFMAILFALLLSALCGKGSAFWVTLLSSLFLLALFGTYVYSVFAAFCTVNEDSTLTLHGLRNQVLDYSGAAILYTAPFQMGSLNTRRIIFLDAQEQQVIAFATSFYFRNGDQAEQAAQQLAQALGLAFRPTVNPPAEEPARETPEQDVNYDELDDQT